MVNSIFESSIDVFILLWLEHSVHEKGWSVKNFHSFDKTNEQKLGGIVAYDMRARLYPNTRNRNTSVFLFLTVFASGEIQKRVQF